MKTGSDLAGPVYLDASAAVKLYVPEPDSDRVEGLVRRRRDLVISDLAVTEIVSAAARRVREGVLSSEKTRLLQTAILKDIESGMFQKVELLPQTFRAAERILIAFEPVALRAADALHLALAVQAEARSMLTFDRRLATAAVLLGLAAAP